MYLYRMYFSIAGEKLISIKWKSSGDHLEDILRCEFPKLNGYSYNLMKSNEGRQLMSIPTPPAIQELKKTIKKRKIIRHSKAQYCFRHVRGKQF